METKLLCDLPSIIAGPGEYILRNGARAVIYDRDGKGTFSCHGSIYREFRGAIRPRGFHGWHVSGRWNAVAEHPKDIVGLAEIDTGYHP